MPSNIERFSAPKSLQGHDIDDGLIEYEDEKKTDNVEKAELINRKTKDIVASFFVDGELGFGIVREKLKNISHGLKCEVFRQWFANDPFNCLSRIEEFGILPQHFQKNMAEYFLNMIGSNYVSGFFCSKEVLSVFDKIIDGRLLVLILNSRGTDVSFLIKNKDKLPNLTEQQILNKAWIGDHEWYDWKQIIPYIDQFTTINKTEYVNGALNQATNSCPQVLFEFKEKIGLSVREIIDLFYENNKLVYLGRCLRYIEPEYHQEIIDQLADRGNVWPIVQNISDIKQVNIPQLLKKISRLPSVNNSGKSGLGLLVDEMAVLVHSWEQEIPKDLVAELVSVYPEKMAVWADKFGGVIDKKELLETLFSKKSFDSIIKGSDKLDIILDESFAVSIIDNGGGREILDSIDRFEVLPREIFQRLMQSWPKKTSSHVTKFSGITKENIFTAIKEMFVGSNIINNIIEEYNLYDDLQLDSEFANLLITGTHYEVLVKYLEKFSGLDMRAIARTIRKDRGASLVVRNLNKFIGLDHVEFANFLITSGQIEDLVIYLEEFVGLDLMKIAEQLIQEGAGYQVVCHLEKFIGIQSNLSTGKKLFDCCKAMDNWDLPAMIKIHKVFRITSDRDFTLAQDIFGDYLTKINYSLIRDINSGALSPDDMKKIGIKQLGNNGVNQLREKIFQFQKDVFRDDYDLNNILDTDFLMTYLKAYVRYNGEREDYFFSGTIRRFRQLKLTGELENLSSEYQPSGQIQVNKVDRKKQDEFKYSEQFLSRYNILANSIKESSLLIHKEKRNLLMSQVETKQQAMILRLKEEKEKVQNPEAMFSLDKKIASLEKLNLRSMKNFQDNFAILAQFKEFHEELRRMTFYYTLHRHKNYLEYAKKISQEGDKSKLPIEEVSYLINFIGHIANEETWRNIFTNKPAVKAFSNITNICALEEEYARAQNQKSAGKTNLDFIPTRGVMMEFSGYIADACWASKYDSIARSFPNFIAMIIVQNKGTKHERLAGASMLIETEANDRTPLLVIRGLNPIENLINSLDIQDFYGKFIRYAKSLAKRSKRKLAIVIDDHSGGSGTNRPALYSYLNSQCASLKKIELGSSDDTKFNGYDIINNCYLV